MPDTLATLIVVTHNSRRWLPRLRAALIAQTEHRWRLVVVDSGSEADQLPTELDLPRGAILINCDRNVGFAAGNNLGAGGAETPFLALLNPDAFPEADWLANLLRSAANHPQAAAFGSTQISARDPTNLDGLGDVLHATGLAYRSEHNKPIRPLPPPGETFSACGAAMLVRREAFEAIGGFDERYFCYFEDVDLCFRLRLAGWRVLQSPDAIVSHVGGGSTGAISDFAEFHGARNRLWTFIKCMPGPLMWLLLPAHLIATGLVATLAPIRGRGLGGWRGIFAGFAGLGPILKSRREVQKARKASLSDIASALTWSPDVLFTRRAVIRKLRG